MCPENGIKEYRTTFLLSLLTIKEDLMGFEIFPIFHFLIYFLINTQVYMENIISPLPSTHKDSYKFQL